MFTRKHCLDLAGSVAPLGHDHQTVLLKTKAAFLWPLYF